MRLFRLFVLLVLMSGMFAVGCETRREQPAKPEAGREGQVQPGGQPEVKPIEPESKPAEKP